MAKHKQPTPEELDQAIDEAASITEEELEAPPIEETPEEPDIEAIEKEAGIEKEEEVEPSHELKERLKEEVVRKTEKLSASARENQKIYAKNRVLNQAVIEANEIPDPTDEELQEKYQDWEVMSDIERKFAKETVLSEKWRAKIKEASDQATKIEKWNESVEEFTGNPQTLIDNPELEGKTDDFEVFAKSEQNNSVPFKTLVGAFLYEQGKSKVPNKGRMFENGSGGPNEKPTPKTDRLSIEDARQLKARDYNKWKEYLLAGRIEEDF
jgi:hypothetical protein